MPGALIPTLSYCLAQQVASLGSPTAPTGATLAPTQLGAIVQPAAPAAPTTRPLAPVSPQLTDTVLMVRPVDFGYNAETGEDNIYEHKSADPASVTGAAMREFSGMVQKLRDNGVTVLVLEAGNRDVKMPDAVFPNNWISVEHDGSVVVYPMKTPDRRAETGRIDDVMTLMRQAGYAAKSKPIYVGNGSHHALEGTGALVIDHRLKIPYAALSERCNADLLHSFVHAQRYAPAVAFHTRGSSGKPFYHTNVMMSIGEKFAVICSEAIPDPKERKTVLDDLRRDHEIIDISLEQTEMHFCANILQLANNVGDSIIVMSENAYKGFTPAQRERLGRYGKLVPVDINIIESVGGGSARCMLAQIFAPRASS